MNNIELAQKFLSTDEHGPIEYGHKVWLCYTHGQKIVPARATKGFFKGVIHERTVYTEFLSWLDNEAVAITCQWMEEQIINHKEVSRISWSINQEMGYPYEIKVYDQQGRDDYVLSIGHTRLEALLDAYHQLQEKS